MLSEVEFDESLIILSDVHLGSDLNDLTQAGARRSSRVDADLVSLLEHYGDQPCRGRRWHLVIAGDFIDFIGMALLPSDDQLDTAPSEEEREHGLGNAADHGRVKLRAVAARHRRVFEAIADFVARGHALTIVHGNHDLEFHWDAVKDEFRALIAALATRRAGRERGTEVAGKTDVAGETGARSLAVVASGDGVDERALADTIASRIAFAPWFFYVGGVAYVEHGHLYDMLCSTDHFMAPLSSRDPRRSARSFSDVLLRWVVRPTGGVPEYGHERMGLVDYVLLGARLGLGGLVRLFARFSGAVVELFRLRLAHVSEAARAIREEHERRMTATAAAMRVGIERLRALAALQVPPVTRSVPKILASVLLDRLGVALVAAGAIGALTVTNGARPWSWAAIGAILLAWLLAHRLLTRQRLAWFGERLDNDAVLVDRAGRLARLFPAAFVVMGHTHTPAVASVAEGAATYVNVGSWHEEESDAPPDTAYRAARTHLVIQPAPSGPKAEFLVWSADGPRRFRTEAPAPETTKDVEPA